MKFQELGKATCEPYRYGLLQYHGAVEGVRDHERIKNQNRRSLSAKRKWRRKELESIIIIISHHNEGTRRNPLASPDRALGERGGL